MRLRRFSMLLALVAACGSDPVEPSVATLPEGVDLEVEFLRGGYIGYPECPDQNTVYFSVSITAPPDIDIEEAYLRSVDVDETVTHHDLEEEPAGFFDDGVYVAAGTTESLSFNVMRDDGSSACADASDVLDPTGVVANVEIHGLMFEVAGTLERSCGIPAPHTCQ